MYYFLYRPQLLQPKQGRGRLRKYPNPTAMADTVDILVYLQEDVPLPQLGYRGRLNEQTNCKVLPGCTVGSRQYPRIGERERRTDRGGRRLQA